MTEEEDVASIIKENRTRIDRLERERVPEGVINLLRAESDTVEVSETIARSVAEATLTQWDGKESGMLFNGDQPSGSSETNPQWVSIDRHADLEPTTEWTVSGWVRKNVLDQSNNGSSIWDKGNNEEIAVQLQGDHIRINTGGEWSLLTGSQLPAHEDKLVTATYDNSEGNGELKLYYDDSQVQSTSGVSEPVHDTSQDAWIGRRTDHHQHSVKGTLDDVRLYNKALTASEVSDLFAGTDVTRGLIARWKFDDPSDGSTAVDSESSHDGTINDSIYTSPIAEGSTKYDWDTEFALDFDRSTSDEVSLPKDSVLEPSEITVTAWIHLNQDDDTFNRVFYYSDAAGAIDNGYRLDIDTNSDKEDVRFGLGWTDGSSNFVTAAGTIIGADVLIGGTYDGSTMRVYLNGSEIGSLSVSKTIDYSTVDNRAIADGLFSGKVDDPRVYNRALSASEMSDLYDGKDITDGLVGRWPFDEGTGTTAKDASENQNHGTLTNSPQYTDPLVSDSDPELIWG